MIEIKQEILDNISYEFFITNRYTITEFNFENINYTAICNNGFIKLHSEIGKAYWLSQNELGHLTPDWKLHVSVNHEDVPKCWNLMCEIFLKNKCRSGMKVCYLRECSQIKRGREITFYIYKYEDCFKTSSSIARDYGLDRSLEHSEDYWVDLVSQIEFLLKEKADGILVNSLPNNIFPEFKLTNNLKAEYMEELDLYLVFDIDEFSINNIIHRHNLIHSNNLDTFDKLKNNDPSYASFLYKMFNLTWTIKGDKDFVSQTNEKVVSTVERNLRIVGLKSYLNNNYLEFYK
jgi:hypothetical protein